MTKNIFNLFFRIFVFVVIILGGFIVAPITLKKLGHSNYGIWVFILSIASYSSILFLGFGTAIIKSVVEYCQNKNIDAITSVLGTCLCVYIVIAIVVFSLFLGFAFFFSYMLTSQSDTTSSQYAICIIGLQFAMGFPFSIYQAILTGSEKFMIRDANSLLGILFLYVSVILLPIEHANLTTFALLSLTSGMITNLLNYISCYILFREIKFNIYQYSSTVLPNLFKISLHSFFISIASKIIELTDVIIIGIFLGPLAVTLYSVPQRLIHYLRFLLQQLQGLLFPTFFKHNLEKKYTLLEDDYLYGFRYSFIIVAPISLIYIVYGGVFQKLWMGDGFDSVHDVLIILILSSFFAQPIINTFLNSFEDRIVAAKINILQAALNVVFSLLLITDYELKGIAIATSATSFVFGFVWLNHLALKKIQVSWMKFLMKAILPVIVPGGICFLLLEYFHSQSWGFTLFEFLFVCLIAQSIFIIFFVVFDHNVQKIISQTLLRSPKDV